MGVVLLAGCRKKKEPTVTPQSQAPTIAAPEKPATTETKPTPTQPGSAPSPTTTPVQPAQSSTTTTATKPKSKSRTKTARAKPSPAVNGTAGTTQTATPSTSNQPANNNTASVATPAGTAHSQPGKVVVQDGGEAPGAGQISAAGNDEQARSRQAVEQLLQSTDSNLRGITRALTDEERAMVEQIHTYMAQARVASTDGDLTRANNLALKAHLLSDELVKR
jgi:outer membrane biosynthesis protein TonB